MIRRLFLRLYFLYIDRVVERLPARITAQRERLARLREIRTRIVRQHLKEIARRGS